MGHNSDAAKQDIQQRPFFRAASPIRIAYYLLGMAKSVTKVLVQQRSHVSGAG